MRICAEKADLSRMLHEKVAGAAQLVLARLATTPELRDPALVSLLVDGLKYRMSQIE